MNGVFNKLFIPRDPAGLGIARFLYGFVMILDIFEERGLPNIINRWGDEGGCYFPLFNDLPRLTLEGIYVVYFLLLLAAIGIMIGFLFRLSCFTFMMCYWYIFFLDKTVWNNHSYLYGLLSILFLTSNANYYWSIDGLIWPSIRNKQVPNWNYLVIRFQLFLLYFLAGIKKLDLDWVSGYSMRGLANKWIFDPFRLVLTTEQIDFYIVHIGGLTLDMSMGFLLSTDRLRLVGMFFAYQFHAMNAIMFNIGMFSYACMALIPIFCDPEWPKRWISKFPKFLQVISASSSPPQVNNECLPTETSTDKENTSNKTSLKKVFLCIWLSFYVLLQCFLPFSHSFTQGYNSWTQGLYGYSWDMMVHSWNTQHVVIKVVDKPTGKTQYLRPGAFVPFGDVGHRIFAHPDMLKQYASCISEHMVANKEFGITSPEIYIDVWKSLNGRFQQRMINPRTDLLTADWSVQRKSTWMLPLLVDLSDWRTTHRKIRQINAQHFNYTDVIFVADFPGLSLDNYIAPTITANITVLSGDINVEIDSVNFTVSANGTLTVPQNTTHVVYTTSKEPSCYMYVYYNETLKELTQEQIVQSDPDLQKSHKRKAEWRKMSLGQRFYAFASKKVEKYHLGLWQLYSVIRLLLTSDISEINDGKVGDEL